MRCSTDVLPIVQCFSAFTALLRQTGELLKTHWLFGADPGAHPESLLLWAVSRVQGQSLSTEPQVTLTRSRGGAPLGWGLGRADFSIGTRTWL